MQRQRKQRCPGAALSGSDIWEGTEKAGTELVQKLPRWKRQVIWEDLEGGPGQLLCAKHLRGTAGPARKILGWRTFWKSGVCSPDLETVKQECAPPCSTAEPSKTGLNDQLLVTWSLCRTLAERGRKSNIGHWLECPSQLSEERLYFTWKFFLLLAHIFLNLFRH